MRVLEKEKAKNFVEWLAKKFQVIAPVKIEGKNNSAFQEYDSGKQLDFDSKPAFSPKNAFFPAFEEMFSFKDGRVAEKKEKKLEQALFWVRACDLTALNRMNALFSRDKKDAYFAKARENAVVFGVKCSRAWENCFCESVGASELKEHDVEIFEAEEKYFFEAKSKKGEKLLKEYDGFEKVKAGQNGKTRVEKKRAEKLCSRFIDVRKVDFSKIGWSEWGKKCFACSNCAMACPSCTCFDVFDELDLSLKSGKRKRTWASCLTVEFASVSNTCFRPLKSERFKQFVMHKFKYYKDKFGELMCTGCGRCIDCCPKGIDVIEVLEQGKKE